MLLVWIGPRPGQRYHEHAVQGVASLVPFLVHRHGGGDVEHFHPGIQAGPHGAHATDVDDVTPKEDAVVREAVRYPPGDFARDLRDVRRRQADMEATL